MQTFIILNQMHTINFVNSLIRASNFNIYIKQKQQYLIDKVKA